MIQSFVKPAELLLPAKGVDLEKWAALACDQFTSQPEYWQQADAFVGEAPSALRLVLPEVYLGRRDTSARIDAIHTAMTEYLDGGVLEPFSGLVYLERDTGRGAVRAGLVCAVDLEAYTYEKGAEPLIRPSENTVVERIPPRLEVRRGAALESPHIMMLMDDPADTVLGPLSALKSSTPLYDTPLMLGGGRVRGWAVADEGLKEQALAAIRQLAASEPFYEKYPEAEGRAPLALAVGDGNHSLATAKAYWEELRATLGPGLAANHPARWCLAELVNLHSPALEIEPIHRLVTGAEPEDVICAAKAFFAQAGCALVPAPAGRRADFVFVCRGLRQPYLLQGGHWPLAVGALEAFLTPYLAEHAGTSVDYIHGEQALVSLAQAGQTGVLLPPFEKSDLFRGVVLGGTLPKKTFSMGHAEEKRYYFECRRLTR